MRCADRNPSARTTMPLGWAASWWYIIPPSQPIRKARAPLPPRDPHRTPNSLPTLHSFLPGRRHPLQQLFPRPTMDARDASATVPPQDLLLSPGKAPASARATSSFQPQRVPRDGAQPPPVWPRTPRSRGLSRPILLRALRSSRGRLGPCRCLPRARPQERSRRPGCTSKCACRLPCRRFPQRARRPQRPKRVRRAQRLCHLSVRPRPMLGEDRRSRSAGPSSPLARQLGCDKV